MNINVNKIIKGHEGKYFYSPLYGNVQYKGIENGMIVCEKDGLKILFEPTGHYTNNLGESSAEMMLFPSIYEKNASSWEQWHFKYIRAYDLGKISAIPLENGDWDFVYREKNQWVGKDHNYSIAFYRKDKDGDYEIEFVGNRPLELDEAQWNNFVELMRFIYKETCKEQ